MIKYAFSFWCICGANFGALYTGVIVADRVISLVSTPSYLITSATAAARRQQ